MSNQYFLSSIFRLIWLAIASVFLATSSWGQNLPGPGNSLPFNGAAYVNCGTGNRTITTEVTAEAWIKTTSSAYQWIIGKYLDSNSEDRGYHLVISNGQAYFNGRIGAGPTAYLSSGPSTTRVDDGRWHHLAGTSNGNVWRIYVDGIPENTGTYTYGTPSFATTTPLTLGNYFANNGQYFQGEMDEVRLWRTVHSAYEIEQTMCRKLVTAPADLVAYYRFDQTSGLTAIDQGSQPANGALVGFSGTPWHISGAALGDASVTAYQGPGGAANVRPGLLLATGDSAVINCQMFNTQGLQVYAVNSAPSIVPGVGGSSAAYVGVFTAGSTQTYSVRLRPAAGPACRTAQQRVSNDLAWNSLPSPTPTPTSLPLGSFTYRGEYILVNSSIAAPTTIVGDSAVCAGATGQLTASAAGATGYRWSTGATTATISNLAPGTYSVTTSFAGSCTSTAQATIRTARAYQPVISGGSVLCPGGSLTLQASAPGPVTFRWNTGATTAALTVSTPGTYSVTATSAAGCTQTTNVIVTQLPVAPVAIAGDSAVCAGATGQLTATATGATGYRWNTGATTATLSGLAPGTYSVTATFATGCTATAQATIRTARVYQPIISGDTVLCSGGSLTLRASAPGPVTYRWNTGATTASLVVTQAGTYTVTATSPAGCSLQARIRVAAPAIGLTITGTPGLCPGTINYLTANTATATTVRWSTGATTRTIAVGTPGTYSVTATTAAGCTQTASFLITLLPTAPAVITGDSALCVGASGQLTASALGAIGYRWSTGATTPTISGLALGTYSVTATFAGNCTSTTQVTLRRARVYQPAISGDSVLCPGGSLTLQASAPGPVTYRWNTGATTGSLAVTQAGTYTVTATSPAGCALQASYRVRAGRAAPTFTLGADTTLCEGSSFMLRAPAGPGLRYQWSDGSTGRQLLVSAAGAYTLRVSSECTTSQATRTVQTHACLTIPNVITPNHDARNDHFAVQGLLGDGWQLDVYDRWGRKVLHTDNYRNDWGDDAAPGVYYVLLQRASTGDRYKGWLEVLR